MFEGIIKTKDDRNLNLSSLDFKTKVQTLKDLKRFIEYESQHCDKVLLDSGYLIPIKEFNVLNMYELKLKDSTLKLNFLQKNIEGLDRAINLAEYVDTKEKLLADKVIVLRKFEIENKRVSIYNQIIHQLLN